jgi:hypothetical protein
MSLLGQASTPYAVGGVLALITALFLRVVRFDRDRAVYPTLLIVVGHYYVLFAVMGGRSALGIELVGLLAFSLMAVLGFTTNLWCIVAGLAGHGAFDFIHSRLIANPGVPEYWPAFCGAFDVGFAACLAGLVLRRNIRSRPEDPSSK